MLEKERKRFAKTFFQDFARQVLIKKNTLNGEKIGKFEKIAKNLDFAESSPKNRKLSGVLKTGFIKTVGILREISPETDAQANEWQTKSEISPNSRSIFVMISAFHLRRSADFSIF